MQDWLVGIVGSDLAPLASILLSAVVVVILVFVVIRLLRGVMRGGIGFRPADGPRVEIVDVTAIDPKRKLVLVRRDQVEHLLLIGGGNDLVIEARIGRPSPPPPRRVEQEFVSEAPAPSVPRADPSVLPAPRPPRPQSAPAVAVRPSDQPSPATAPRYEGPSADVASRVEARVAPERSRATPTARVEPVFPSSPVTPGTPVTSAPAAERPAAAPARTSAARPEDQQRTERGAGSETSAQSERLTAATPQVRREAPLVQPDRAPPALAVDAAPPVPRPQPTPTPPPVAARASEASNPFAGFGSAALPGPQPDMSRQRDPAPIVETDFGSRTGETFRAPVVEAQRSQDRDSTSPRTADAPLPPVSGTAADMDRPEPKAPLTVRSFASSISERPRAAPPVATPVPQAAQIPTSSPTRAGLELPAAPAALSSSALSQSTSPTRAEEEDDLARMLSQELSFDDEIVTPRHDERRRNEPARLLPADSASAGNAKASPELSIEEEMERLMRDFSAHTNDRR